eukprot:601157_1
MGCFEAHLMATTTPTSIINRTTNITSNHTTDSSNQNMHSTHGPNAFSHYITDHDPADVAQCIQHDLINTNATEITHFTPSIHSNNHLTSIIQIYTKINGNNTQSKQNNESQFRVLNSLFSIQVFTTDSQFNYNCTSLLAKKKKIGRENV